MSLSAPSQQTDTDREEAPAHSWAADLGSGLASTATDTDPSGISTYSLAGMQYGFDLLWMLVLSYPSMVAFQLVAARIAALTEKGLTANMREHYPRILFYLAVARFLIANVFNIAADTVAMGVAAKFLWNGSVPLFAALSTALSILLQLTLPYPSYVRIVKWLTLTLFSYVGVVLVMHVPLQILISRSLVPQLHWTDHYFSMMLAVLGTTISPYLLFSQATKQVEELRPAALTGNDSTVRGGTKQDHLRKARRDTLKRTAFSNAMGFVIMVAAGAAISGMPQGLIDIQDVARVLQPISHGYAAQILGLAFIGTALIALPPLAGSAAQAAASLFESGSKNPTDRRVVIYVIILMTLGGAIGVTLLSLHVEPLRILYWGAVVNGSTATPVMVMLVLLSTKHAAVGDLSAHWALRCLCWLATACAGAALASLFILEWFH